MRVGLDTIHQDSRTRGCVRDDRAICSIGLAFCRPDGILLFCSSPTNVSFFLFCQSGASSHALKWTRSLKQSVAPTLKGRAVRIDRNFLSFGRCLHPASHALRSFSFCSAPPETMLHPGSFSYSNLVALRHIHIAHFSHVCFDYVTAAAPAPVRFNSQPGIKSRRLSASRSESSMKLIAFFIHRLHAKVSALTGETPRFASCT